MLATAVLLRDGEIVLEYRVGLLERVGELVALEDVVLRPRCAHLAVLGFDGAADRPDAAVLALEPDDDRLRSCRRRRRRGAPAPRSDRGRTRAARSRLYNRRGVQVGSFLRNPFSFLFARTAHEDRVAEYVIREHHSGRALAEIFQDHFVHNRLTPQQQARVLEREDVIRAFGDDLAEAAQAAGIASS